MHFDDRSPGIRVLALIYDVQIFLRSRAIGDHGGCLLTRFVETPLGIERGNLLSALEDIHHSPFAAVVGIVVLGIRLADQRVRADGHLVAEAHLLLFVLIEDGAGEANHDYDYAEVDDVSAVAAGVAMRELDHRREKVLAGMPTDYAASADEFRNYGERHKRRQHDGHQRVEVRNVLPRFHAEHDQQYA